MISVEGKWIGVEGIGLAELAKTKKSALIAVTKATLLYEAALKKKLIGPRTGRIYKLPTHGRGGGRRRNAAGRFTRGGSTYQASAPGEPPALATGEYRKSITHIIYWNGSEVLGNVGTKAPQGRILEYGGMTGRGHLTRILPRPHFAPTFLEQEQNMLRILAEATK